MNKIRQDCMTGRERRPIQSQLSEPFGDVGTEIMYYAGQLIESFSAEPENLGESDAMPRADGQALADWLGLEHLLPMVEVDMPVELQGKARRQAYDALSTLHMALPFSEAERGWLVRLYRHSHVPTDETLPGMIETREAEIMSAGVKRVANGRELMRRWTAWRREADEFSGQGSFDQAREALQRVQEMMS
jgi:hypothetical protein